MSDDPADPGVGRYARTQDARAANHDAADHDLSGCIDDVDDA